VCYFDVVIKCLSLNVAKYFYNVPCFVTNTLARPPRPSAPCRINVPFVADAFGDDFKNDPAPRCRFFSIRASTSFKMLVNTSSSSSSSARLIVFIAVDVDAGFDFGANFCINASLPGRNDLAFFAFFATGCVGSTYSKSVGSSTPHECLPPCLASTSAAMASAPRRRDTPQRALVNFSPPFLYLA
jgi:hypothetical protein